MPQHSVTCCNILWHATTLCDMLQRSAACCSTLWHATPLSGMPQHSVTCCSTTERHSTPQHSIYMSHFSMVHHNTNMLMTLWFTAQHVTFHKITQHSIMHHNTVAFSGIPPILHYTPQRFASLPSPMKRNGPPQSPLMLHRISWHYTMHNTTVAHSVALCNLWWHSCSAASSAQVNHYDMELTSKY